MSDYGKELEMRFQIMKKRREMDRRGPVEVEDKAAKSAESRRLGRYLDRMRKRRKQSMREFDEK